MSQENLIRKLTGGETVEIPRSAHGAAKPWRAQNAVRTI